METSGKGLIPPCDFISVAEETGLIIPMGIWAVEEACRQNKEWQTIGLPKIAVAVNFSMKRFSYPNLVPLIKEKLRDIELGPEYLEIELTETVIMENLSNTRDRLKEFKELGIKIAIDDFGTGHSSLSYLKDFPIDYVKIDKSFIDKIPNDKYGCVLTKSIISLAHSLDLKVVGEGVEDIVRLEFLKQNHCDLYQGYLFSPPVPASELSVIWKENLLIQNI